MPNNNWWLYNEISKMDRVQLDKCFLPLIRVAVAGKNIKIYTPNTDEYIVNCDVVQKARDLGADVIAHSTTWVEPTLEAQEFAGRINMRIMTYGEFFRFLREAGRNR